VTNHNITVEEAVIHWECSKCGAKSSLKFTNGSPVGLRLREGAAQHKILSPACELDWDCITIINEIHWLEVGVKGHGISRTLRDIISTDKEEN
jgi:hypothetical protein